MAADPDPPADGRGAAAADAEGGAPGLDAEGFPLEWSAEYGPSVLLM